MRKMLLTVLLLTACKPAEHPPEASPAPPQVAQQAWRLPVHPPAGELRVYGRQLIVDTARRLGPDAPPGMRFGGNRLNCTNCHLDAGQRAGALGFVGITARYPQYKARENRRISLAERIDGCFERSLNGRPLPPDSREMRAIEAYLGWLSEGYTSARVAGQGLPELALLPRAADPAAGQKVYAHNCLGCHQAEGRGLPRSQDIAAGYAIPPLAGPDSFNDGAGMHRLLTAARFIRANMPLGAPTLTDAQAYDVAAYINSLSRPAMDALAADYPDRLRKPVDAPFAPWADAFSPQQHRLGPYAPMLAGKPAPGL